LITKRQEVSVGMGEELTKKLREYGIIADNINILDLSFSEAFNQAIEAKQVAQQNALKAQQDLERVKVEAEQQIAQARAEAESYKLKNQEITDKTLKLKWIEKWNGQLPSVMSDGTNILDLSNLK
jgi:regulator of protease activity HflC (stomatin/prohibitin superfamily)